MTTETRLLVIQNDPTCPLGRFEGLFEQAGVGVDLRRGFADDEIPSDARGIDGVIVLGGAMSANDTARCSWLSPVQELIRSTVRAGVPFLGVCLGLQLAAVALGGEVVVNPNGRAAGLVPIGPAPGDDPLLGGLSPGTAAIQWNDDIVRRPPPRSAVVAASPDGTPQAIRFGPRAWGVQFHPEVTGDIFRSWLEEEASADGVSETASAAWRAVAAADDRLRALADTIARRFLSLCRAARAAA